MPRHCVLISPGGRSSAGRCTSVKAICAPCAASLSAVARPIPFIPPAPVIRAILPSSPAILLILSHEGHLLFLVSGSCAFEVRQDILLPVCYYGTYPYTFKHDLSSWDSEGNRRWQGNSRDGLTQSAPQSARQHCDSHHCNSPFSTGCNRNCAAASALVTLGWYPTLTWY